jgi:HNH endonuclease
MRRGLDEHGNAVRLAYQRGYAAGYAAGLAPQFRAGKRLWSAADDDALRRSYPAIPTAKLAGQLRRSLSSVFKRAELLGLRKSDAYLASPDACRLRRGDHVGKAFWFPKGHVPANKGLRRPGWSPGRMAETQFKAGVRAGIAVKLWKPIGTERVSKDGYLERKINNDLPLQRRWRAVHLILWEAAHGRLPPNHAIAFRNGDKADVRLDNLECITRRQLMARNSVHNLPKPLAAAVQLLGALNRQIHRRTDAQQDRRSA